MTRYIKQLTYTKLQCERRLRLFGLHANDSSRTTSLTSSISTNIEEMVPSFKAVMQSRRLRELLEIYLAQQGESQASFLP